MWTYRSDYANNWVVDPRRLRILLALSRLGSMREVAETLNMTTSTVSQQLAALAKEAGVALIEPEGRRVRLTPAGRRLADHAVTILAALDAAQLDLDPHAEPAGTVRVGGRGRRGLASDGRWPRGVAVVRGVLLPERP